MGYLIALIIVLLLVAGFVAFFVLNATRKGGPAGPEDPGAEGHPAGIAAPDEAPLGDTTQHAGEQREGETVAGQDAETAGGSGRPAGGGYEGTGEIGSDGRRAPTPESERLANRPR